MYNFQWLKLLLEGFNKNEVSSTNFSGIIIVKNIGVNIFTVLVEKQTIQILRRVRHLVSLQLYPYSLLQFNFSFFSYCNIIWESTFHTSLQKMLLLQKRFVKIATREETADPYYV